MRFEKFLIFFLIFAVGVLSPDFMAGQSYKIQYHEESLERGVLYFEGALYSGQIKGLPVIKVDLPDLRGLEIAETKLQILSSITRPWTDTEGIPEQFMYASNPITVKGQDFWIFELIPVRKTAGGIELITEFSIEYTTQKKETSSVRSGPLNTFESVLANGDIYKIAVDKTGICKLDFNFLETTLGIKTNQINPKNIKIYGNGGGRLPVANSTFRHDDLVENAVMVFGENDGKFDNNDYILFYAQGPDVWSYNETSNLFVFDKNIYDDFNYYFLKIDNDPGLRIEILPEVNQVPELVLNTYESLQHFEEDKVNLLGANPGTTGSGKEWYGDYYKGTREIDYSSKFDFTHLVSGSQAEVKALFVGRASKSSTVNFIFGDHNFSLSMSSVNVGDNESTYAHKAILNQKTNLNSSNTKVSVLYPNISVESEGWLDYIQVISLQNLVLNNQQLTFRNRTSKSVDIATFSLQSVNNHLVWDITNPLKPKAHTIANNALTFLTEGTCREFIAHQGLTSAFQPVSGSKLTNQNLHQYNDIDMLVVYHPDFENAVQEFKQHRSSFSNLNILTASVDQIYNEFSSGRMDPVAIRDLARMLYTRKPSFNYLLLFGDGSYDYKGLMPNLNKENFVPVYETDQSLNPIIGFPADDFYGLLDENDGSDLLGGLDIAVGRLPAKSATEADIMVKKIIHYDTSPATLGDWRLRTGYAADDEDSGRHIIDTDEIARRSASGFPLINQQKVYFDAFPQVSTAGDPRFPEATQAINSNIFAGQLTLTYLGHGGPQGWAQERVLTLKDIKGWTNYDKLFLMITATCSFAAYDDPKIVSPGEEAILNAKGGAIALYSTTRAVYTNSNKELTDAVHRIMFQKTDGQPSTFGQILKEGKNKNSATFTIENSRKFTLLGDPSQAIALPKENVVITHINKKPIGQNTDTLKAMTFVEIEGIVTDKNQQLIHDFDGTLNTTIYDKKNTLRTLQNDTRSPLFEFDLYQNIIFKGKTSVKDGKFAFGFWIPKDINYNIDRGRISLYAHDGTNRDAAGYTIDVLVGGSATNGIVDDTPPKVDIYMNDESFVPGGITNENPILLLNLEDDFGINVTGNAVGHDITSILNDNTSDAIVLNDFFEAETDNYKAGTVKYPLKNLATGKHTIRVKAWDIANNSTEKSTEFLVVNSQQEFLDRVINYPNPFTTNTKFEFEHDLSNTTLDIHVYIYSISGKLIKTVEHSSFYTGNRVNDVKWNGRDDFDDRLARGVYLYKIKVHAKELNLTRESKFEKLVIL